MKTTTNKAQDATADYLASLGVDPATIPDVGSPVVSVGYTGQDAMAWQGETYQRLSPEYEFYRATQAHNGVSVKQARAEGYVPLPKGHDARMVGAHDPDHEVIMIRRRTLGEQVRADRERARAARHKRRVDASGVSIDASRHEFEVGFSDG